MFVQRISSWKLAAILSLLTGLSGLVASCRTPTDRQPPMAGPIGSAVPSAHSAERFAETPPTPESSPTDEWIQRLLAEAGIEPPVWREAPDQERSPFEEAFLAPLEETEQQCLQLITMMPDPWIDPLSEDEVYLFINAGVPAIPLLMRHIRDDRLVPRAFPRSPASSAGMSSAATVAELACYLIEAIVRKKVFFHRTAWRRHLAPTDLPEDERDWCMMDRTEKAYERWYDRCFDEESQSLICPVDELILLDWDCDHAEWMRRAKGG